MWLRSVVRAALAFRGGRVATMLSCKFLRPAITGAVSPLNRSRSGRSTTGACSRTAGRLCCSRAPCVIMRPTAPARSVMVSSTLSTRRTRSRSCRPLKQLPLRLGRRGPRLGASFYCTASASCSLVNHRCWSPCRLLIAQRHLRQPGSESMRSSAQHLSGSRKAGKADRTGDLVPTPSSLCGRLRWMLRSGSGSGD